MDGMMSGTMEASFQSQWRQSVQSSPEAAEARRDLEMQRRKIRQIHEELRSAEVLEKELEVRLKTVEIRQKPALLSFAEKLEELQGLEEDFIDETFSQVEETKEIISVLREKEKRIHQMNRSQLLGFIKSVLLIRDCFLEREDAEGVNTTQVGPITSLHCRAQIDLRLFIQEIASSVLANLGSTRIKWSDLVSWEAEFLRFLVEEVEGIPVFLKRMVQSFFNRVLAGQPQDFARVNRSSHSTSTLE